MCYKTICKESCLTVIILVGAITSTSMAQQPKLRLSREAKDFVFSVAFSHDSKLVAGACGDGSIKVWSVATGNLEFDLTGPMGQVRSLAFHPSRYLLASGGGDVKLWELPLGKVKKSLEGPAGPAGVESLAFSHDGKTLAAAGFGQGGKYHAVVVWDVDTAVKTTGISMTYRGGGVEVHSVAFQGDKKVLALGTHYHEIGLWDMQKRQMQAMLKGHRKDVFAVAFSDDGKVLASASDDETVRLWDPATGREKATLNGHTESVHAVAVSPNGKMVASGSHDKSVRLWDTATGKVTAVLNGHKAWVFSVAFSKNGKLLASAGGGYKVPGEVKVWELPGQ